MAAWHITAKDLYLLLRDRRTFAILLLLPLIFIVIIGLTTGKLLGWQSSNLRLTIVAVDVVDYEAIGSPEFLIPPGGTIPDAPPEPMPADQRTIERNIAGHIVASVLNDVQSVSGVEVRTVSDWQSKLGLPESDLPPDETARKLVADGEVNAALIFRPDFYHHIYHLQLTELAARSDENHGPIEKLRGLGVELLSERPDSASASAIAAIVGYQLRDVIEPILGCRSDQAQNLTIAERGSPQYRKLCGPVNEMGATPPPELMPPRQVEPDAGRSVYDDLVPSYTVMFVFFLVNIMARSFLSERELGTMRRLRIAPIPGWSILVGKTVPFFTISLLQTFVLFLSGRLLFSMSWGTQPLMLLPIIIGTSAAATGLGLLLATIVRTDSQVSAYANTVLIVLAGISGCFMPRQWLPELMQQVSLATPHAWALIAYEQLLEHPEPNLAIVWQSAGMLMAFAAGFFLLGALRFRSTD